MTELRRKAQTIQRDIKRDPVREGEIKVKSENKIDFSQFAIKNNLSVPNAISFFRILLIPPILITYFNGQIVWAIVLIVLSGISDGVDGFIARRYGQITALGKVLDPVADKLTQVALAVCLCVSYPEVLPLLVTLVIKELMMLIGGLRLLKSGQQPFSAKIWGKVATVLFYCGATAIIIFSDTMSRGFLWAIVILLVAAMLYSMICYGKEFHQRILNGAATAKDE